MEEVERNLEFQLAGLKKESIDATKAVRLVEDDIKQIKSSIENTEHKILESLKKSDAFQVRIAILNGRAKNCDEKNLICEGLAKRMQQRADRWKRTSRLGQDKTYYSKENGKENGKSEQIAGLESFCNRKIRLTCEQIMALRKQQLTDDVSTHSERRDHHFETARDQLWTKVEEMLKNFSPKEIMTSVCENTKLSAQVLLSKSHVINLTKDAEDLRFKFESGKLKDVSEQPVLLQSVDQLIEEGQAAHFQRFLEAEKAQNDTWREKKRFEKTQQHLNNILEKKYGSRTRELGLKRRVVNLETELYGIQASTAYIKELINDLKSQRAEKQKAEKSLQMKYRMIQQFETEAQYKQLMIQSLVKQNGSAKNRLEHQQNELHDYLDNHMRSLGKEIDEIVDEIGERITREMQLFAEMRISQLKTAQIEIGAKIPCEEMSIHRLDNQCENHSKVAANAALQEIAEELEFSAYLAPENLLKKITEVKELEFDFAAVSSVSPALVEGIDFDATAKKLAKLKEMCMEFGAFHMKDKREAMPIIHESLSKATDALKDCLQLEKMVNIWWHQPAQVLVPWVKEDGMNLTQWHTQWDVNSARLSQFQLSR